MQFEIFEFAESAEWERIIATFGQWNLFQSYTWGEVQRKQKWQFWRFAIRANKKIIGVFQIGLIRAKRGSFLHVRHGPVLADEYKYNKDIWKKILFTISQLSINNNVWFLRISPMYPETSEATEFFRELGFRPAPMHRMDAEVCWVLDLAEDTEMLLKNMRKTTRYLIRQADKMGVVVKQDKNIETFLRLYQVTAERHGFVQHESIREEFEIFGKAGKARLYVAEYEGKPLAAAIILYFGKQAIYHHGASLPTKIPASYRLQWQAIQDARRSGMQYYNFWGIAPTENKKHPWRGITLFKQGFGGREQRFLHAQDLPLSPFYLVSYTIETVRKRVRGY